MANINESATPVGDDPNDRLTDKAVIITLIVVALFAAFISAWMTQSIVRRNVEYEREDARTDQFIHDCQNKNGWAFEMKRGATSGIQGEHPKPEIEWRCFKNEVLIFP
jgi:hypothetical protein